MVKWAPYASGYGRYYPLMPILDLLNDILFASLWLLHTLLTWVEKSVTCLTHSLVSLGFSSCFGILPVDYTSTQLQLVLVLGPSSILSPDIDFCSHSPMRSHLVLSPSFSHSRPLTDKSAFILHWDWEWLGLLSCCTSLCLTLLFNMIDGTGTFTKWSPFSST